MDFYFVYSSGGGAGDWNGINRIFRESMPQYFKNNLLIKFGDVFFNHRSSTNLLKTANWRDVANVRAWLVNRTGDNSLTNTRNLILDVGTTKIVSYITNHNGHFTDLEIINEFNNLINRYSILEKYAEVIVASEIDNAITFDIPNLFKVRTQNGNVTRNLFSSSECRNQLINLSATYANHTYSAIGQNANKLLTIVSAQWSDKG